MPQTIVNRQKPAQKAASRFAPKQAMPVKVASTAAMTKIRPFRAVRYNQEKIKNLSQVTSPPYDVISAQEQEAYHSSHPYNFLRILLSKDNPNENKYELAGKLFRNWQKEEILIQDPSPSVYFYSQTYNLKGEKKTRFGFMALLRLGGDKSKVYVHENTRLAAREDRSKLLEQVKANLSPIFVVFADEKRIISRIIEKYLPKEKPLLELQDKESVIHKLWKLDSAEVINSIQSGMEGENIFIADGHHRYEVACAYRDELIKKSGSAAGEENFNYILAYFTNIRQRGLTILPIHRLVRLSSELKTRRLKEELAGNFDLEEVKDADQFFFLLNKAGESEHIIGMYKEKKYWFLRLKNVKILDKIIIDKSPEYRQLDVSILNYLVLKNGLKLDIDDHEGIIFSPWPEDLIKQADQDQKCIAFFLNPVKVQQIMAVALKGEKMPSKSTYFYPKVLSGLVINKLE